MARKVLLICGIVSSLLYVAMNVLGAMQWEGYSSISQTVSELFAIGAPSRPLWVLLGILYQVLATLFGWGVWASAGRNRASHRRRPAARLWSDRLRGTILSDAPAWNRTNAYGHHAQSSRDGDGFLHADRHRVRGYSIRKAISRLFDRDITDTSCVRGFGGAGRSAD